MTPIHVYLANSENPGKMLHDVAFYQCLRCLLQQKQSSYKEKNNNLEIIAGDPSIYTMDHPKFIVSIQREECIKQ